MTGALRYEAVLFDFDGTLVDSRPGIEAAATAALSEAGLVVDVSRLDASLGLPLDGLIAALGPSLGPSERATLSAAFARHYDATGWLASRLYPGVRDLLESLRTLGVRLFVVTNKRRTPTLAILRHHGLADLFEAVYTLDSAVPPFRTKAEMAQACMRDCGLRPEVTLVVGDSAEDGAMARACRASFAAATWGYGRSAGHMPEWVGLDPSAASGPEPPEFALGAIAELAALVVPGGGIKSPA